MNKKLIVRILFAMGLALVVINGKSILDKRLISGAPPYGVSEEEVPENLSVFDIAKNWVRPDGPPRVGLQVGHWKNDEVPEELERLKGNTGATGGGKSEWEVNHSIAIEISKILEQQGIVVDILPTTVPKSYWADVFVAIHADGSTDPSKSGYKFAGPWRDLTGDSDKLVSLLENKYDELIGTERDPNVTRNMRGYYAFSWWKNEHAVHPMTTAVIAETGFLTNRSDQRMLINTPELPAQAIAEGLIEYLKQEGLL